MSGTGNDTTEFLVTWWQQGEAAAPRGRVVSRVMSEGSLGCLGQNGHAPTALTAVR